MMRWLLLLLLLCATPALAAPDTPGTATGVVQVFHNHMTGYEYYVLLDNGVRQRFRVGAPDPRFQHGDRVRASWTISKKGGRIWTITPLVVRSGNANTPQFGNHPGVIILAHYKDKANLVAKEGFDVATLQNFYSRASYGAVTLTLDVVGPFTINVAAEAGCDFYGHATKLDALARAAGVDLSKYLHKVYAMPSSSRCGWAGLGTVGGNPSQAWINGRFNNGVAGHELGHNFSLWHSHAIECGTTVLVATGCSKLEYGDTTDIMGGGASYMLGFNPPQLTILGWLPQSQRVTAGTFTLKPLETVADALRIARPGTNDTFWVSHRGIQTTSGSLKPGVVVHWWKGTDGDAVYLLDMTPLTTSWSDPALCVGCSWTDPLSKITIRVDAVSATGATVTIGGTNVITPPSAPTLGYVAISQSNLPRPKRYILSRQVQMPLPAPPAPQVGITHVPITITVTPTAAPDKATQATVFYSLSTPPPVPTIGVQ